MLLFIIRARLRFPKNKAVPLCGEGSSTLLVVVVVSNCIRSLPNSIEQRLRPSVPTGPTGPMTRNEREERGERRHRPSMTRPQNLETIDDLLDGETFSTSRFSPRPKDIARCCTYFLVGMTNIYYQDAGRSGGKHPPNVRSRTHKLCSRYGSSVARALSLRLLRRGKGGRSPNGSPDTSQSTIRTHVPKNNIPERVESPSHETKKCVCIPIRLCAWTKHVLYARYTPATRATTVCAWVSGLNALLRLYA